VPSKAIMITNACTESPQPSPWNTPSDIRHQTPACTIVTYYACCHQDWVVGFEPRSSKFAEIPNPSPDLTKFMDWKMCSLQQTWFLSAWVSDA
jgi:hypothetical protein